MAGDRKRAGFVAQNLFWLSVAGCQGSAQMILIKPEMLILAGRTNGQQSHGHDLLAKNGYRKNLDSRSERPFPVCEKVAQGDFDLGNSLFNTGNRGAAPSGDVDYFQEIMDDFNAPPKRIGGPQNGVNSTRIVPCPLLSTAV
jgi:hypothetical protein